MFAVLLTLLCARASGTLFVHTAGEDVRLSAVHTDEEVLAALLRESVPQLADVAATNSHDVSVWFAGRAAKSVDCEEDELEDEADEEEEEEFGAPQNTPRYSVDYLSTSTSINELHSRRAAASFSQPSSASTLPSFSITPAIRGRRRRRNIPRFDGCVGVDLLSRKPHNGAALVNFATQHCEKNPLDIITGLEMRRRDYAIPLFLKEMSIETQEEMPGTDYPKDAEARNIFVAVPKLDDDRKYSISAVPEHVGCQDNDPPRARLFSVYAAIRKRVSRRFAKLDVSSLSSGMHQVCLHDPNPRKPTLAIGFIYLMPKLPPPSLAMDHAVVVLGGHVPIYSALLAFVQLREHRPGMRVITCISDVPATALGDMPVHYEARQCNANTVLGIVSGDRVEADYTILLEQRWKLRKDPVALANLASQTKLPLRRYLSLNDDEKVKRELLLARSSWLGPKVPDNANHVLLVLAAHGLKGKIAIEPPLPHTLHRSLNAEQWWLAKQHLLANKRTLSTDGAVGEVVEIVHACHSSSMHEGKLHDVEQVLRNSRSRPVRSEVSASPMPVLALCSAKSDYAAIGDEFMRSVLKSLCAIPNGTVTPVCALHAVTVAHSAAEQTGAGATRLHEDNSIIDPDGNQFNPTVFCDCNSASALSKPRFDLNNFALCPQPQQRFLQWLQVATTLLSLQKELPRHSAVDRVQELLQQYSAVIHAQNNSDWDVMAHELAPAVASLATSQRMQVLALAKQVLASVSDPDDAQMLKRLSKHARREMANLAQVFDDSVGVTCVQWHLRLASKLLSLAQ
ncbi:MAG: hypothetical protein MHM6MM_002206 [Cercozoa sp. M6MM]